MIFAYKEDLLQFIWENQLYDQQELYTEKDEKVTVVKQGFLNQNSGPDFENAEIKIGDNTFFGSVEIHVHANDWAVHKHQTDPAYNNVILHVCYYKGASAQRQDLTPIPTVYLANKIDANSLEKYKHLMEQKQFVPCENQINQVSEFDVAMWKERMIIERLEFRHEQYETFIHNSNQDWNQAFYTALVRAFGMPINGDSFEEIALQAHFDIIQKHHKSLFQLEALLFGVAGLLADKKEDNYYIGLQKEYTFLKRKYGLKEISCKLKMGRMRPMNLPHVKIAQIAALFHHVPLFISDVLQIPSTQDVKQMLDFELSEYWSTHYTFDKETALRKKSISTSFVHHLFLNAIVPFVFFYERKKKDTDTDHILSCLNELKSEKNSIIKRWENIGVSSKNALESQALLHLYKTYCLQKRCLQCAIGKKLLSR